jgi:hypothetical protein
MSSVKPLLLYLGKFKKEEGHPCQWLQIHNTAWFEFRMMRRSEGKAKHMLT